MATKTPDYTALAALLGTAGGQAASGTAAGNAVGAALKKRLGLTPASPTLGVGTTGAAATAAPAAPAGLSASDFNGILNGPESTLKQYAQQFVSGGGQPVSAAFANSASSPATQQFVNNNNLADYLKLAGDSGNEQTAGLIQQGDPTALTALAELRKRLATQ